MKTPLVPSRAAASGTPAPASSTPAQCPRPRLQRWEWWVGAPTPVVLHIVSVIVYSLLGIGQFLASVRRRHLGAHRALGRHVLVPAGFVVALSGMWMTATYDVPAIDGLGLLISRSLVGAGLLAALVLALVAVGRRGIPAHAAWMLRAYALAVGAGTQVLTSLPPLLLRGPPDELGRLLPMDAGWLANVAIADIVIPRWIRPRRRRAAPVPAAVPAQERA